LDLVPIIEGEAPAQALRKSLELARHVERLGYTRYWVAEHHNMKGIAAAATSVVIGYLAAGTSTIRVGAGGIMLPNHAPLIIAEQFGTLEALYPGRVETGVVPRETFWGDVIWADPPTEDEEREWIAEWHAPYHARLAEEVARMRAAFGVVVLLDLHSVASRENRIHGRLEHEIYLGNRDGASCGDALIDAVERAYRANGFSVVRNHPNKGGCNPHHYGPLDGGEALQVETTQRCYMDEDDPPGAPASGRFAEAKQRLSAVFTELLQGIGTA
jgi:hypothetical protein